MKIYYFATLFIFILRGMLFIFCYCILQKIIQHEEKKSFQLIVKVKLL